MTRSTLQRLSTIAELRETWHQFWRHARKQTSTGVDRTTPAQFSGKLESNLRLVHHQLLTGYQFSALVAHPVPKPDGKKDRIICIPTVQDRLVQRLIGGYLLTRAQRLGIVNDASYGFIRSTSTTRRGVAAARDRAITLRRENPWAYKSDIMSFFDRIPRNFLFDKVVRSIRTPSIHALLHDAIHCEIDVSLPAIRRKVKDAGIKTGLGVRQGMPLSPFFANIVLKNFDQKFLSRGFHLVRYADDFVVFVREERDCHEVDRLARDVLGELGFEIPELGDASGKTMLCQPNESVEFLGMALTPEPGGNYSLKITLHQLEKIRRRLNQLKDLEYLRSQKINMINLTRLLENRIGGYRSAYAKAANLEDLNAILEKARKEVLTNIFVTIFGGDAVTNLTTSQKQFLSLED